MSTGSGVFLLPGTGAPGAHLNSFENALFTSSRIVYEEAPFPIQFNMIAA